MNSTSKAPPTLDKALRASLDRLASQIYGEIRIDDLYRRMYSTDASEYQERPLAVVFPLNDTDVGKMVAFAAEHGVGLIPRTAGTSLAGQVVGGGIVVDTSRFMTKILSIDASTRRVRVQPGVVRNELNMALKPYGLLFGPETSTANRAMIGGMVGNNSCGSNSLVYGSTRDHLVWTRGFLSDGSEITVEALSPEEFEAKCGGPEDSLEARIYRSVRDILSDAGNRKLIEANFPKKSVTRRNTGYALDQLMDANVFDPSSDKPFNLCRLICGSEGTLFFGVEFELECDPLPPPEGALMCAHFETVIDSLKANLFALKHNPSASELIDRHILECTKQNKEQARNRFFVDGDPGAILVVEIRAETRVEVKSEMAALESELREAGLGYHYPVLWGEDCGKVWELRRAGQGVMSNVVGDKKPREVVEDTAVDVQDLPEYIEEFDRLMREKYGISCVYYAHAGSGELHTRPLFNLKTPEGVKMFRSIAEDIAALVKRYQGSLSGEHGDGRLRGEFIEFMVGSECYSLMREIKAVFDPHNIFNPGKVIDTPPMDTGFRYEAGKSTPEYETIFDFSDVEGVVRAAEKCNGSGDCRKTHLSGGTMCPSYMATRNEKDTTRARANMLRQILSDPPDPKHPFANNELKEVMDLCLSCKACKSECPSNVDIAKLKAEFLQHYYDRHGAPMRSKMIGDFSRAQAVMSKVAPIWNWMVKTPAIANPMKRVLGFAEKRSLPPVAFRTLRQWFDRRATSRVSDSGRKVYLFGDEFTLYQDVEVGIAAIELLERLGYQVVWPKHEESGRTWISKGFLRKARERAIANVNTFSELLVEGDSLIGIEPSAILTFRDEYPALVPRDMRKRADELAAKCFTIEEFLIAGFDKGYFSREAFKPGEQLIRLHGHCYQKAISSVVPSKRLLELPRGYKVQMIPSGCCGMAGSFGYESEHFEVSMQVGELVLFPTVRSEPASTIIAAAGTSCRHQIFDGTGREALHPVQVLRNALVD